jgi:hypothetical protein
MARIVLAVFCQSAIVDGLTNNLSIFNQYDEVHPSPPPEVQAKKGVPMMAFQCALASVWERDREEISESVPMRIRLVGPQKKSLPITEGTVDLRKSRRFRLVTNLPGLPVIGEGTYTFLFEVRLGNRWKRVGDTSLFVNYRAPALATKAVQH